MSLVVGVDALEEELCFEVVISNFVVFEKRKGNGQEVSVVF